ncbi:MAG: Gfo/Idh/MocA family oxidoreductase [Lentisphaeria bacterium]|nr:Gfo/Idh/MocA family oxidoreductase [Lentisphaeria bacterium]
MAENIRVGIVGCGMIATKNHLPAFTTVGGFEVTALCDILPERMAERAESFELENATRFTDCNALFASGLVDAVAICTPNDLHCPQTIAACEAGLHVLCEKPMAGSLEESTAMIAAAKAAGVVLQINQSIRYSAPYRSIVDAVESGAIGEVFHARCIRAGAGTPNKGWSPGADWFVQKKHEGGLLVDIGIHMADLLRQIMGDAKTVAGLVDTRLPDIDVPDNINALFRFESGATATLELSWTLPGGAGFLEIYGTEGRIRMGFNGNAVEMVRIAGGKQVASTINPAAHCRSQDSFRDAVLGVGSSLTPGEYGRRALALCLAIEQSSTTGQFVDIAHFEGDNDIC